MNVKKLSMFEHEVRVLSFSSSKLFLATMAKREVWDVLQSIALKGAASIMSIKKGYQSVSLLKLYDQESIKPLQASCSLILSN